MANFFNPASPYFRRGVFILSVYATTLVGGQLLLADYGTQEHVFSPVQRFLVPKIDDFFGVADEEIKKGLKDATARAVSDSAADPQSKKALVDAKAAAGAAGATGARGKPTTTAATAPLQPPPATSTSKGWWGWLGW